MVERNGAAREPGPGCRPRLSAGRGIHVAQPMGMATLRSECGTPDALEETMEDLRSELGEVEWIGTRLRVVGRRGRERARQDEASIWSRLLAWTQ